MTTADEPRDVSVGQGLCPCRSDRDAAAARRETAELDVAGRHEPSLREGGVPADVLARLLPGDDVVEL